MTTLTATKPLFAHQDAAASFAVQRQGIAAFFMECGTGKTRAALELFSRLSTISPRLKLIITAPLSLLNSAWGEDVVRFTNYTYYNAHDNGLPESLEKIDILSINYESLIQPKNKHFPIFLSGNLWVIDESSKLKNHSTITTKTILDWARYAKYRIVMSGTPAPNSPLEYWAQIEFLWPGYLDNFSKFRNRYFHLARGNQVIMSDGIVNTEFISQMIKNRRLTAAEGNLLLNGVMSRSVMSKLFQVGAQYSINERNFKDLMQQIAPFIFLAKKKDCLDLPEQLDEVRQIEMTKDQAKHYKRLENDLITEIRGSYITAPVALAKMMKLREITSGWAYDSTQKIVDIVGATNPKLCELDSLLDELGNQPVIIWACFVPDIERIGAMLSTKYGEDCFVTLYSGTKDHDGAVKDFQSGAARFLVANPQSAAHGLTFVNCSTQIFFSLDYSYERYDQAKSRTHRAGQVNKCTYIHLIAKESIDEEIIEILKNKGDMNEIAYKIIQGNK